MGVFEQGGGGGKSPSFTPNTKFALSKPYEIVGEPTPEKMSYIDEMLALLFASMIGVEDLSNTGIAAAAAAQATADTASTTSTGVVRTQTTNLSQAQLSSLSTVPITAVDSPGAGFINIPIWWSAETNVTTPSGGPAPSYRLRYAGTPGTNLANNITTSLASSQNRIVSTSAIEVGLTASGGASSSTPGEGVAIEVDWTVTGGGSFAATAKVVVAYYTVEALF